jgi:hypothetical protein
MKTKIILLIALSVCLAAGGVFYVITQLQAPVEPKAVPRLSAYENRLVDENNNAVTLRGVSIADPYFLDHIDNRFSEDIFAELSTWNINVVRVPIHPGAWKGVGTWPASGSWQDGENYAKKYLDPIVSWGKKYGFYIILDWHAIGNPLTGQAQGNDPNYDSSLELAKSAWMELAERYGENSWVIFELFNEPASIGGEAVSWGEWRNAIEALIDNIRTIAPKTLILVSGWQWTYNLRGFYGYPIRRDNIAYVAHVYATHTDPEDWEYSFGFLAKKYPLIVTEWGFSPTDPGEHYYGTREGFGQPFLKYMEEKNISWVAWCFHTTWKPTMIKNWDFEPTELGNLVKQALTPDNVPPTVSITTPLDGATVNGTVTIEGMASDDVGLLAVEIKIGDEPYQPVANVFDQSYREDNWSYSWWSLMTPNGSYTITIRARDFSGKISTQSITVELDNPIDETPPTVSIETPSDGALLSGIVTLMGSASDESGVYEVRVSIDNKSGTSWASTSGKDRGGLFFQASYADEKWSLSWDTTAVNDGAHTINVRVMDLFGNISENFVQVIVVNDNLLADCENEVVWSSYSGGGSSMSISLDEGVEGNAIKATYKGSESGWWGIVKGTYYDFSGFSGIEFYLKGTPNRIRIQIEDSGGELWVHTLTPSESWEKVTIRFNEFSVRGDWQNPGTTRNGVFDLNVIWNIQFIHTTEDQSAEGTFWIDEIRLVE